MEKEIVSLLEEGHNTMTESETAPIEPLHQDKLIRIKVHPKAERYFKDVVMNFTTVLLVQAKPWHILKAMKKSCGIM